MNKGFTPEKKYLVVVPYLSEAGRIIFMAFVTGANILYTEDNNLICDFNDFNKIDAKTFRIKGRQTPQRKVIKSNSLSSVKVRNLMMSANASFDSYQCMIKSGGC